MLKNNVFLKLENNEIDFYEAIKIIETEIENKKNEGVVYTPKYIADFIISNIEYDIKETIYEPSVGHGIFLFSLFEYVKNKFYLSNNDFSIWFNNKVFANELSKEKHEDLIKLLSIYFKINGIKNISFKNITCGDSLLKEYEYKFEVLIGNPPYIRTKNIENEYLKYLKNNFYSCKESNIDIFYAFIELSSKIAKRSSLIVPNSLISNKSATKLRELIKPKVDEIIDFKSKLIFDSVRTYTCIYKLSEKNSSFIKYSNDINSNFETYKKENLENKQWLFNKSTHAKVLPNNIKVRGETATLKDHFYIIENPKYILKDGKEYVVQNFEGEDYLIEKEATIIFNKVTKMDNKYKIINPYDQDFNIIPEEKLKIIFPKLYEYFIKFKEDLNKRDKGKTEKYESWYSYGRKQGLIKNNKKYHLFIPKMSTLPLRVTYVECDEDFLFKSGYVISFSNKEEAIKTKEILLSDKISDYIKRVGKEWPGKSVFYTFSINHLKNI